MKDEQVEESAAENETARDAYCPKCRAFREVIWTPIEIMRVYHNGRVGTFKGLEMRCRICDVEITKVGCVGR